MESFELIRSARRTIAIQIKSGRVIVRAPLRMSKTEIERFVVSKADWINKHLEAVRQCQSVPTQSFTEAEIQQLADVALQKGEWKKATPCDTKDEKIHDFGGGNNDIHFVRVLSSP